ncbi:unnamed protein product, partial [Gordionus sp. m RMFG-2023]
ALNKLDSNKIDSKNNEDKKRMQLTKDDKSKRKRDSSHSSTSSSGSSGSSSSGTSSGSGSSSTSRSTPSPQHKRKPNTSQQDRRLPRQENSNRLNNIHHNANDRNFSERNRGHDREDDTRRRDRELTRRSVAQDARRRDEIHKTDTYRRRDEPSNRPQEFRKREDHKIEHKKPEDTSKVEDSRKKEPISKQGESKRKDDQKFMEEINRKKRLESERLNESKLQNKKPDIKENQDIAVPVKKEINKSDDKVNVTTATKMKRHHHSKSSTRTPSPKLKGSTNNTTVSSSSNINESTVKPVSRVPFKKPVVLPSKIHVGRLTRHVTRDHLKEIFGTYGRIKTIDMPMDRNHFVYSRGFAYIDYESSEEAAKAQKFMNGGQIDGQEVIVAFVIPMTPRRSSKREEKMRTERDKEKKEDIKERKEDIKEKKEEKDIKENKDKKEVTKKDKNSTVNKEKTTTKSEHPIAAISNLNSLKEFAENKTKTRASGDTTSHHGENLAKATISKESVVTVKKQIDESGTKKEMVTSNLVKKPTHHSLAVSHRHPHPPSSQTQEFDKKPHLTSTSVKKIKDATIASNIKNVKDDASKSRKIPVNDINEANKRKRVASSSSSSGSSGSSSDTENSSSTSGSDNTTSASDSEKPNDRKKKQTLVSKKLTIDINKGRKDATGGGSAGKR